MRALMATCCSPCKGNCLSDRRSPVTALDSGPSSPALLPCCAALLLAERKHAGQPGHHSVLLPSAWDAARCQTPLEPSK
jgi:hypothetical protein